MPPQNSLLTLIIKSLPESYLAFVGTWAKHLIHTTLLNPITWVISLKHIGEF